MKRELYGALVERWDASLLRQDELGLVFMDGNGTEPGCFDAHRKLRLSSRHVIEDPLFQVSHRSQWIQMADLVAYSAFLATVRPPGKEFAWGWYARRTAAQVQCSDPPSSPSHR